MRSRATTTTPHATSPPDEIVKVGFNDNNIRHIPYTRGSLYFADLDSRIRAHSDGKRNLDTVLFELFRRRERGERFDHGVWIKTVVAEAGPGARENWKGSSSRVPKRWCRHRMRSVHASSVAKLRPLWWTAKERPADYEWVRVTSIPDDKCRQPW